MTTLFFKKKKAFLKHTSFSSTLYSLTLSTATMLVSSSEVILTSQLRVCVTYKSTQHVNNCPCVTALPFQIIIIIIIRTAVLATDIEGGGYGQANQAAVQGVSGDDGKQGCEEHDQVSNKLQADGQPSADKWGKHMRMLHQKT